MRWLSSRSKRPTRDSYRGTNDRASANPNPDYCSRRDSDDRLQQQREQHLYRELRILSKQPHGQSRH